MVFHLVVSYIKSRTVKTPPPPAAAAAPPSCARRQPRALHSLQLAVAQRRQPLDNIRRHIELCLKKRRRRLLRLERRRPLLRGLPRSSRRRPRPPRPPLPPALDHPIDRRRHRAARVARWRSTSSRSRSLRAAHATWRFSRRASAAASTASCFARRAFVASSSAAAFASLSRWASASLTCHAATLCASTHSSILSRLMPTAATAAAGTRSVVSSSPHSRPRAAAAASTAAASRAVPAAIRASSSPGGTGTRRPSAVQNAAAPESSRRPGARCRTTIRSYGGTALRAGPASSCASTRVCSAASTNGATKADVVAGTHSSKVTPK